MEVKNLFVNFEDGSNAIVYTRDLSTDEVKKWAELVQGPVVEVYHIPQNDLQYYCIDERIWADNEKAAARIRAVIAQA